jgi:hypothetical protein
MRLIAAQNKFMCQYFPRAHDIALMASAGCGDNENDEQILLLVDVFVCFFEALDGIHGRGGCVLIASDDSIRCGRFWHEISDFITLFDLISRRPGRFFFVSR